MINNLKYILKLKLHFERHYLINQCHLNVFYDILNKGFKNLKYLSITSTDNFLPETINGMYQLETLKLKYEKVIANSNFFKNFEEIKTLKILKISLKYDANSCKHIKLFDKNFLNDLIKFVDNLPSIVSLKLKIDKNFYYIDEVNADEEYGFCNLFFHISLLKYLTKLKLNFNFYITDNI